MKRTRDDILPAGTPIDGWGGTAAKDHNDLGLYSLGPQPRNNPLARFIHTTDMNPALLLPPDVARISITRDALIHQTLRRKLLRGEIRLPKGGRLRSMQVGRGRR